MVAMGWWLDLVVFVVFSNLNKSVILLLCDVFATESCPFSSKIILLTQFCFLQDLSFCRDRPIATKPSQATKSTYTHSTRSYLVEITYFSGVSKCTGKES